MGSTYTVRPNSLVPGAKAGAQAAYTTMPYGSAGGWQAGSQFRRELPILASVRSKMSVELPGSDSRPPCL